MVGGIKFCKSMQPAVIKSNRIVAVGGDGSWRRVLTLANILRLFNPDLLGVSTGTYEVCTLRFRSKFGIRILLSRLRPVHVSGGGLQPGGDVGHVSRFAPAGGQVGGQDQVCGLRQSGEGLEGMRAPDACR